MQRITSAFPQAVAVGLGVAGAMLAAIYVLTGSIWIAAAAAVGSALLVGLLLVSPPRAFPVVVAVLALGTLLSGEYLAAAIGGVYVVFLVVRPIETSRSKTSDTVLA